MKKYFTATLLSFSSLLLSLPVGNPADPKLLTQSFCLDGYLLDAKHPLSGCINSLSFRIGALVDVVANRNLTQLVDNCDENQDTLESQLNTQAAYFGLSYCDRFDVFAQLGATQYMYGISSEAVVSTDGPENDIPCPLYCYSTHEFSWSIGGRLIAIECSNLTLGVEAQYLQARPKIAYFYQNTVFLNTNLVMGSSGLTTHYTEWQVGLGASYQIGCIVPYMAIKWAGARLDMGDPAWNIGEPVPNQVIVQFRDLKQSKDFGFAVGATIVSCGMGALTAEARFADEVGYSINAKIRF